MTGVEKIQEERLRQISSEGWTPEHDDEHDDESLAWAAVCFAAPGEVFVRSEYHFYDPWPDSWAERWDKRIDKHGTPVPQTKAHRIHLLTIAGALCAAEIDRLERIKE